MFNFIIRRVLVTIPLLIAMSFFTFMLMQLAPGDILAKYRANPQYSEKTIAEMEAKFHFDEPPLIQYGYWLGNVVRGDMGWSFTRKDPVTTVIKGHLVNTLILSLFSIFITWFLAIPLGIYSAVHQYKWGDKLFSFIAYIGISVPNFFLALLLLYLVSTFQNNPSIAWLFKWIPLGGMKSPDYDTLSAIGKFFDVGKHLIIPGIVLGTSAIAGLQRIMRGNMLEELRQRYVTTARAKGLPENKVIYKHALRNAINPLITIFGYQFSALLSGAALIEIFTDWPGLGMIMLEAVRTEDIFLVMGNMLMAGTMLIAGNLLADILLAATEPRIKLS